MNVQGKAQVHKTPEKTLSVHLRLIFGTDIAYIIKPKTINRSKQIANSGKGGESDTQSYLIIKFKYPVLNKKSQRTKRNKVWLIQMKKLINRNYL